MSSFGCDVEPPPDFSGFTMPDAGACKVCIFPRPVIAAGEALFDVTSDVWLMSSDPLQLVGSTVEQDHIMHRTEPLRATVGACSFPNDLVTKLIRSEHCVHQHLQVMTG